MADAASRKEAILSNADIGLAFGIVGVLIVMVVPVPAQFLDLLLAGSITSGMIVLLVAVYITSPLQFSVFPSLLLVLAIFRLSLNVATTRNILLYGNSGTDAAGKVIEAFGEYVAGGNYVVGIVIFIILVLINFKVITGGATRASEVAARFTLDAMPGKQMSIDADLNAGYMTEEEAQAKRKKIEEEASFFGAMDGALKFVRGDAVAGIIITIVNIVAGFAIGVFQQDMTMAEAAGVYTILTIGDGLVSQLPSLLIATASGLVITRSTSETDLGRELTEQLMINPRAFGIAAAFLTFLAIVPGMPTVAFLALGMGAAGLAFILSQADDLKAAEEIADAEEAASAPAPEKVEALLPLDAMELEIGYELIPLVDSTQDGELLERIKSIRRQFALEMGIIVPPLHIRDNLQLKSNEYQILIKGVEVAHGELWMNHHLAIDPGTGVAKVPGIETIDPTFGLPALWVAEADKEKAKMNGYTVVDVSTVISTHIKEVIRTSAHELLGRQDVQSLVETFAESNPKVVEELIPGLLTLGQVQKVLQNLLREGVSIRDLQTVLETLADNATIVKDTDTLTEYVRTALARQISKSLRDEEGTLSVMTLDPDIEEAVSQSIKHTEHGAYLALDPTIAQKIIEVLQSHIDKFDAVNAAPTLLTGPAIRYHMRKLTERFVQNLSVLSHNEVSPDTHITSLATVTVAQTATV